MFYSPAARLPRLALASGDGTVVEATLNGRVRNFRPNGGSGTISADLPCPIGLNPQDQAAFSDLAGFSVPSVFESGYFYPSPDAWRPPACDPAYGPALSRS